MSWKRGGYQNLLEKVESLLYYRWVSHQNPDHKIQDEVTGEVAAILLADLVEENKMKMHKCNITVKSQN